MHMFNSKKEGIVVTLVFALVLSVFSGVLINRMHNLDGRMTSLEEQLQERESTDKEILDNLKKLHGQQEEIKKLEKEKLEREQKREQEHASAITNAKELGLSSQTDLVKSTVALNTDDMNRIIDNWTAHMDRQSVLKGHGEAFITASKETGLNPIYILAHAIVESGCGTSYLAINRGNFFGINAIDTDPGQAYAMGDTVDEGIINGAKWIKRNYYDNGYTTLDDMKAAGYATSNSWKSQIVQVANTSVSYL